MTTAATKLDFVCIECLAVNRVPVDRLLDRPVCAKCKTRLIPDHPVELTDANFSKFISRTGALVVIDFWADWCGPCRAMAPNFAKAHTQLAPNVLLAKVDTESNRVAIPFNITGIPCLIAFKNGNEIARQAGMMNTEQIVAWVNSLR